MFEKRRFRNFLIYMNEYEADKPATHKGYNLNTMTAQELYTAYGLDAYTQEFIGHAMAMFTSEDYLRKPAVRSPAKAEGARAQQGQNDSSFS